MPQNLQKGGMQGWTQGAEFGTPIWLTIYTTIVYGVGIGVLAQPQLAIRFMTVSSDRELNRAILYGGIFILLMTGVAYIVGSLSNAVFYQLFDKISIQMAEGNMDKIIPVYIEKVMPSWFSGLFLLAMFAAAMSTLSSQYHTGGTSLGRDLCEQSLRFSREGSIVTNRVGVCAAILLTLIWAWCLPTSIIARATAFFFGLCAASFLPVYLFALYWKGITKVGAIVSLCGGFVVSMFWLLFFHKKEAAALGVCELLFGRATLSANAAKGSWFWLLQWVDPNVVALPISFALAVLFSLLTKKYDSKHLEHCWRNF